MDYPIIGSELPALAAESAAASVSPVLWELASVWLSVSDSQLSWQLDLQLACQSR
jgi:hypothetical protein